MNTYFLAKEVLLLVNTSKDAGVSNETIVKEVEKMIKCKIALANTETKQLYKLSDDQYCTLSEIIEVTAHDGISEPSCSYVRITLVYGSIIVLNCSDYDSAIKLSDKIAKDRNSKR